MLIICFHRGGVGWADAASRTLSGASNHPSIPDHVREKAALTVPPDPTAAAFFDVDNTMMQGASIFHFARGLAARGFFHSRDLFRIRAVIGSAQREVIFGKRSEFVRTPKSAVVKAGAGTMPSVFAVAGSSVAGSVSAGSLVADSLVVVVPPLPPHAASTTAVTNPSRTAASEHRPASPGGPIRLGICIHLYDAGGG